MTGIDNVQKAADIEHSADGDRLARIELSLHGYPAVRVDGCVVPFGLKRGVALLVVLCEVGREVARSTLGDLIWPDAAADVARGRLRRLVHETNRALGIAAVVGDADALWFAGGAASVVSDVERTRRSARNIIAASTHASSDKALLEPGASDLLEGFTFGADTFDEWLAHRRAVHRRVVACALQRVAEQLLVGGEGDHAAQVAARLIAIDPLADAGHALLLRVHAQRGDLGAFESSYLAFAELMRGELGVRPSPSYEALYEEGRQQVMRVAATHASPSRVPGLRITGAPRRAVGACVRMRGCRKCSSPEHPRFEQCRLASSSRRHSLERDLPPSPLTPP